MGTAPGRRADPNRVRASDQATKQAKHAEGAKQQESLREAAERATMTKKMMEMEADGSDGSDVEVSDDESDAGAPYEEKIEAMSKAMAAMAARLEKLEKAEQAADRAIKSERTRVSKIELAMERKVAEVWTRLVRIERKVGLHPDSPKSKPKPQAQPKPKQPEVERRAPPSPSPSAAADLIKATKMVEEVWATADKKIEEMAKCVEQLVTGRFEKVERDMADMKLEAQKTKNDVAGLHEFVVKHASPSPKTTAPSAGAPKPTGTSPGTKAVVEWDAAALSKISPPDVEEVPYLDLLPEVPMFMCKKEFTLTEVLAGLSEYVMKVVKWSHAMHAKTADRCRSMELRLANTRDTAKLGFTRFARLISNQRESAKSDMHAAVSSSSTETRRMMTLMAGETNRRVSSLEASQASIFEAVRTQSSHLQTILEQVMRQAQAQAQAQGQATGGHRSVSAPASANAGVRPTAGETSSGGSAPKSGLEKLQEASKRLLEATQSSSSSGAPQSQGGQQPSAKRARTETWPKSGQMVLANTPESALMAQLLAKGF